MYNISTKKEENKMKVYKPVFDGKWVIAVLDTDLLRRIPGTSTVCYTKRMLVSMVVCIIQTTYLKQEKPHKDG